MVDDHDTDSIHELTVPAELAGERADLIVARLASLPRSAVTDIFGAGGVTGADGAGVGRSDRLEAGTALQVVVPVPQPVLIPVELDLTVLFEDADVAVVDKPAGLVTHPGAGTTEPTLAAGVLHAWPEVEGVGEPERWGLVHRLDKETSGALLVAKTAAGYESLVGQLASRQLSRTYHAVCHGLFEFGSGTVDAPIARDRRHPTRFAVDANGRSARTHYERLERWQSPAVTLIEVALETGRTHQIRVHMASIGHPVVGDSAYGGGGPEPADPGRVWLHARRLGFEDVAGVERSVDSPLPADLRESLARLGPSL